MTTAYAPQAASALATLRRKGAAVAFVHHDAGTYDPATDAFSGASDVTVSGYAVRVGGNPLTYTRLGLVQSEAPSLLFGSTTPGALPALNAVGVWNDLAYVVRDIAPVAPDGPVICATIVVSRG